MFFLSSLIIIFNWSNFYSKSKLLILTFHYFLLFFYKKASLPINKPTQTVHNQQFLPIPISRYICPMYLCVFSDCDMEHGSVLIKRPKTNNNNNNYTEKNQFSLDNMTKKELYLFTWSYGTNEKTTTVVKVS